ncbi:structural protein (plasmid) [Vibrio sp. qd031]|uniref:structural protein n=1 Tax=Vibrio sp. qd031 TaxID=1603038 RepID=UPI000A0F78AB|nr:structural protein [Vibrio sp. qd031]ORT52515.1 structural protein [Vibrio sp. qd031]
MDLRFAMVLIAALLGFKFMESNLSTVRGIRNNNPLNIRKGNDWQGETSFSKDAEFESFTHEKYGFRAGAKVLQTYQNKYGLYSVREMIARFAPSHENDTDNYSKFVAGQLGISETEKLDLADPDNMARMIHAMSIMEVGRHYTLDQARQGVALA